MNERVTDHRAQEIQKCLEDDWSWPAWIRPAIEDLLADRAANTFDDGLRRVLEKLIAATQNLVDNWYPDVDQATALSSIDEMLADARAILSEVSTATQPDETIDKMLEAHGSGQERGYNDGLRRAAEIARNFGDLYCRDSPCPTCEHIAQAILAELTSTTQPTRSLLASPELVEQIKHLAELVGLKFIPFGDKP